VAVTVANVAPSASITGPTSGVPGQPLTFTVSATDVAQPDQAAGFVYTIDWGDGSPQQTVPRTAGNGSGVAVEHAFLTAGDLSGRVPATDKDGGTTNPAFRLPVALSGASLSNGVLTVGGTAVTDTIVIALAPGSPATAAVTINGGPAGSYMGVSKVVA